MKTEVLSGEFRGRGESRSQVPFLMWHFAGRKPSRVAPSLRIPVLPANRAYLRALRAAELAAWQATSPCLPA
jgi:hypothetical protein